jgi:hypothetical protein
MLTKADHTSKRKGELTGYILCIQNKMPMSSQSSYAIIELKLVDSTFNENIRLMELSASSDNGTGKSEKFDNTEFYGKGFNVYKNVARNFNLNLESLYGFKLTIETESGKINVLEIKNVKSMVVE